MALKWPYKDPQEVLDYKVDWSKRLGTDTIVTSTWPSPPAGITVVTTAATSKSTTVWLSGGTEGQTYTLVNRIVTAAGRTMDQSIQLLIKTK